MRAGIFGMIWLRTIPAVVAVMGLAVIGGTAEKQLAVAQQVALVASIDESSNTVGLADSNLARLGDEALIDKQLDMMQSIGVKNVRIGVSWAVLKPFQHLPYDWASTNYDYVVDQALKRGMGVLAVLNETPLWAGDKVLSGMPTDVTQYGDFAAEVAAHFKGKVSDYEVWNEPNATFFLDPVSPGNYTSLLKEAYTRIKAVDQDTTVIGGVLGFGFTVTLPNGTLKTMNPVDFLAEMYEQHDAHGYFDALSFHPYKPDIKFSDQVGKELTPLAQLEKLRKLMIDNGDADLKIWATEYGLPTVPGGISQQQQADFIKDFLEHWGKVEGTGPMFIYSARDLSTGTDKEQENYGIWETDWTAKLAVGVIRDFLAGEDDNPIIDFVRNAIMNLAKIAGAVIKGIANVTVGIVNALVDATVWVVKTIAKVTGAVVQGIVDVTKRIATAICNTVHAVVDRIQNFFDRNDTDPTLTSPAGARSLRSAAAELSTTAAEVGATKVPQESEFETATVDLNEASEVAAGSDATDTITELAAEAKDTADTAVITETTEIAPEPTPTTTVQSPAKEDATELTPATTAPPAEKAATTSTPLKDLPSGNDDTPGATTSTKPNVLEQDEDEDTAKAGTSKTDTVKNTTSAETNSDSPDQESSSSSSAKAGAAS